ncbi:flagellar hook-length control protein FliK [bacterium]|nr:flagellar hook-length control protein FliK [bacterium]
MNAMNLLALMFAAPPAAQSATQVDNQILPDGGQFKLLLEQGLFALPAAETGATTATDMADLLATEQQLLAALHAGLATSETTQATGSTATTGLLPMLASLADTLDALAEQLRQALEAVLPTGASADDAGTLKLASAQTATLTSLQEALSNMQATLGLGADADTAVMVDGESTDWLATQLPGAWRAAIRTLNALTAGQAKVTAGALVPNEAQPVSTGLPWSVRSAVVSLAATTRMPGLPPGDTATAVLATTGGSEQLPASIQWFQTAGIVSLGPQPADQPAGETLANAVDVTPAAGSATQPLTTQISLSDGTEIKLSLASAPLPATLNVQQYDVTVTCADEPATTWQAQLTVQRLDFAALPQAPGAETVLAATPTAQDWTQVLPQQFLAANLAATDTSATGQPLAEILTATTGLAQAITSLLDPTVTANLEQSALTATIADPQSADSLVKTVADPLVAAAINQSPSILTKDQPALSGKSVALVDTTTAETLANAEQSTGGQSNAAADWAADQVLDNLLSRTGQPVPVVASDSAATTRLGVETATTTLDTALLDPSIVVNVQPTVPQQLQFTGTTFEISQYTGLQYLELAERIQEQVAQARSAGNGLYNAHLNLNPPSLGKMFVNISVRGEAVALQIAVASTVPREQLKDSLDALRQSLEDSGLYVVDLMVVEVDGDEDRNGQQQADTQDDGSAEDPADQVSKSAPAVHDTVRTVPAIGLAD